MGEPGGRGAGGAAAALRARLAAAAARWPLVGSVGYRTARRLAARHRVGVVAVVLDGSGRVLVVRHAFRDRRWSLPGGWAHAHEQPADAVVREVREELGVAVVAVEVVGAESHREGVRPRFPTPSAMTIAYRCAPADAATPSPSAELTAAAWLAPSDVLDALTPFDAAALREALVRRDRARDGQAGRTATASNQAEPAPPV